MTMWRPSFVCPECQAALAENATDRLCCVSCARESAPVDRVWKFLTPARHARLAAFAEQYRVVRGREGRRVTTPAYYRALPNVPATDPHARDWRIRQETFRHLLGHVLAAGSQPSTVLDLGAGSGWLAHRLAALGHLVVAVDAIDDDADGLGAVRHFDQPIVAIHADFDALPLAPRQFDLVVFNGSLHYAPDPAATLARARRVLNDSGTIVVMDSPMFSADRDGAAMIADAVRRFATEYGLREIVLPGCGYLTFAALAETATRLRMHTAFVPSRGPLAWRLRRHLSHVRKGRRPASFGLWMAR
jgi:SAM-dependent methyltransferase